MTEGKRAFRCPSCHTGDGLWESITVQGWRSIDAYLDPTFAGSYYRDIEWHTAERDSWASPEVGCSCGWEGARDALQAIGIDGEPLPMIHPGQQSLEVPA